MGRIYSLYAAPTWASTALDIFTIKPADDHPVKLLGFQISQATLVKDANEQTMNFYVVRGYTTVGSGGSVFTARPMNPNSPAFSGTVRTGDTTGASGVDGSTVTLWNGAFNVRGGYEMWFPKGCEPVFAQTGATDRYSTLSLTKVDSTSIVTYCSALFEEL